MYPVFIELMPKCFSYQSASASWSLERKKIPPMPDIRDAIVIQVNVYKYKFIARINATVCSAK